MGNNDVCITNYIVNNERWIAKKNGKLELQSIGKKILMGKIFSNIVVSRVTNKMADEHNFRTNFDWTCIQFLCARINKYGFGTTMLQHCTHLYKKQFELANIFGARTESKKNNIPWIGLVNILTIFYVLILLGMLLLQQTQNFPGLVA